MAAGIEACSSTTTAASCATVWSENACGVCMQRSCCGQTEACTAEGHCAGLIDCILGGVCAEDDEPCLKQNCSACFDDSSWNRIVALNSCAQDYCASECGY
jgi:hypothetical protein